MQLHDEFAVSKKQAQRTGKSRLGGMHPDSCPPGDSQRISVPSSEDDSLATDSTAREQCVLPVIPEAARFVATIQDQDGEIKVRRETGPDPSPTGMNTEATGISPPAPHPVPPKHDATIKSTAVIAVNPDFGWYGLCTSLFFKPSP
ncbi:hypothetical protein MHUMG1_10125 [Metarhizium humberi]|uniref:Uncharacterized protein n=1 Tax=Metarhizium humberi TaxID=2596975 RepID=A0A9P8S3H1_9HYPO|nr:hypothetical protein MHUMG1_10125 [Metarhizium humberi]